MRTIKIDIKLLEELVKSGKTTREIGIDLNISNAYVSYLVRKFNLLDSLKYKKPIINIDYFQKIDTKEKAYILGFLLADGCLTENKGISCAVALVDEIIIDFISEQTGAHKRVYTTMDIKTRRFPNATFSINIKQINNDLHKLFGGYLKEDRHIPRIKKELESYMILGLFDADGCITFGKRKDRNRLWQKISFTSKLNILAGIQNILLKQDISTKIYKKKDSDCYILDICDKKKVVLFLDYIYNDLVVLDRKYNKAQALRLELGELGKP